ncbi:MAG: hypothetical protein K2Q18_08330 [Bdellovibrionales bacterium]|nr:hypothetical protein [Bdellovibrionales bacterium]
MNHLIAIALLIASSQIFASEKFDCDFAGPNYLLSIEENGSITLQNSFKSFACTKGTTSLPGTEVDLNIFNCVAKNDKVIYFYGYDGSGDLFLSKSFISSNDIHCKRL